MEIFTIQFSPSSTIKLSNKKQKLIKQKTKTYVVNHYIVIIGTWLLSMEISINFLNKTHIYDSLKTLNSHTIISMTKQSTFFLDSY